MASRFGNTFQERVIPAAERAFGVTITYLRRGDPVTLTAFRDSSVFESSNAFGVTQTKSKDFLISVANLVLRGAAISPEKGDMIEADDKTYVVTSLPGGRPDEYDDDNELMWRVHATLKAN